MSSIALDPQTINPISSTPTWFIDTRFNAKTSFLDRTKQIMDRSFQYAFVFGVYTACTGGTFLAVVSTAAAAYAISKLVAIALGLIVYPASIFSLTSSFQNELRIKKTQVLQELFDLPLSQKDRILSKEIKLQKAGITYDAVMIGSENTLENGKWSIHALGNCQTMENSLNTISLNNLLMDCNTLVINGPGVGLSGGLPLRERMGDAYEAGLQYLEHIEAKHVIIKGFSLGGGMLGEAILKHNFSPGIAKGIRYLSVSDRTFSRLSTIASTMLLKNMKNKPLKKLLEWTFKLILFATGTELDGVGAAKKLSQLGIQHIIINGANESDGVIADDASLAHELNKGSNLVNRTFLESSDLSHNEYYSFDIENKLKENLRKFLGNAPENL